MDRLTVPQKSGRILRDSQRPQTLKVTAVQELVFDDSWDTPLADVGQCWTWGRYAQLPAGEPPRYCHPIRYVTGVSPSVHEQGVQLLRI
jgi:hypothetical protein